MAKNSEHGARHRFNFRFSACSFICIASLILAASTDQSAIAQAAPNASPNASFEQLSTHSQSMWPKADYDPAIPTIKSILGYESGERITTPADIIRYFEALAKAAPDRIIIKDYGKTWQGRRLIYAIIGTPQQISNIETIRANSLALADPRRTNQSQANAIISNQPTIVWLANSVHGDEISPADSAMMSAYHLLATRGDNRIEEIRKNTLTIIVPLQNPDGRERFINSNIGATGNDPDPDEFSAERDQPWPGGRMNHYNFDLNRDWISITQPETQGHESAFLQWYPQIMVDAHEMGREGNFFFPPEADPINPNHTLGQRQLRAIFGANNARWFDSFGINYFTREVYDGFYPGYGDGWPSAQGTIAMTYEQASSRGLVSRGKDGKLLTYRDTVRNHFIAALSTIETSARERTRILNNFYDFRKTAILEGQSGTIKSYIISNQNDGASAQKLAAVLVRQGIEVEKALYSFSSCANEYPSGSFIVRTNQPTNRLIRNLLDKEVALDSNFVAAQLNRRERGLEDEIYDVTAWSMPLMYNVDARPCSIIPNVQTISATNQFIAKGEIINPKPKFGFLIASRNAAMTRFGAAALRANIKIRSLEEDFVHNGKNYPAGTLVVINSENNEDLNQKIAQIAQTSGANIIGIDNSWVEKGPSFASIKSVSLRLPRIAIAWDSPTDPYSAGNLRYIIEQKIGFNVTPIRTSRIRTNGMGRFDVLILPDTNSGYLTTLGDDGTNNLKAFAQNGGTIIGIGSALRYMTTPNIDLLNSRRENAVRTDEASKAPNSDGTIIESKAELARKIIGDAAEPTNIDGAILQIEKTEDHWLSLGLNPKLYTMYQGSDIFRPLPRTSGVNPLVYSAANELVASGVVWDNNRRQLALKPFAMVQPRGRGFIIGISADISYRAHIDGLDGLIFNAIVQSSARANPNR